MSSTFLVSGFSKAYAETMENESPVGFIEKFLHNGNIENNPYADKGINFEAGGLSAEELQRVLDFFLPKVFNKTANYAMQSDGVLQDTIKVAIDCLSYIYNLITHVIIATPSVIFNSTWFSESYLKFAGLSVVVFTIMALWNAGRKTFNLKSTALRDVVKRYFLAVTGIGFATFFFQQFFKVIKFISEIIVSIGYNEIYSKDFSSFSALGTGDTVALVLFILVLIGLTVKIVLENGRRWFGLASIGLMSSFSLSAWVFDSTRVVFNDVKEKFIKLSLTQVYHASVISLMGVFLVSTAGVNNFTELIIKLSTICGAFTVLAKPPKFFDRLIDKNTDTVLNMVDELTNIINYKMNPAFTHGTNLVKSTFGIHDKITAPSKLEKRLKTGKRFVK